MPDSTYYKPHQLAELRDGYSTVNPAYERLMGEYLSLRLTNEAAYEYVRHGFVRRLGTLKRCIENVYSIYPPERSDKPLRGKSTLISVLTCKASYSIFLAVLRILHGFGSRKSRSTTTEVVHYGINR